MLSTLLFRIASNGKIRSFPHHCIAPQREIKVPVVLRLLGTWMQVDRRNETGSPLQALALYNNGFMLTLARRLAARVERVARPSRPPPPTGLPSAAYLAGRNSRRWPIMPGDTVWRAPAGSS